MQITGFFLLAEGMYTQDPDAVPNSSWPDPSQASHREVHILFVCVLYDSRVQFIICYEVKGSVYFL